MKNSIAIQLNNVTKTYTIHHEKPTLVEKFIKGRDETFTAIKNISLSIRKGDKVGIIGPNGSGKTTLLKIIAGITAPTSGSVTTHGRIISLIDLQAGFHPDLTGYQNIFLNAMLLGMDKSEIYEKLSSIINFSGISKFIDVPLFTYSSGMVLRLGFSIAMHSNPDLLILDEGISVGDNEFQYKAKKQIWKLFNKNKTILIVSQDQKIIEQYSKKIIIMNRGIITDEGNKTILKKYFTN